MLEARKLEEIQFHNDRELDRNLMSEEEFQKKYSNKKWYAIARKNNEFVAAWLEKNVKGKTALDYCCGLGEMSLRLAKYGADLHGIDISDESVKTAKELLASNGFKDADLRVMDAENLEYPDNTFDVIVCSGVLHHLDLDRAYRQLARVLKPGGKIICMEALAHNPIINLYRKVTPHLRTAWEVDHILSKGDIMKSKAFFRTVDIHYFHLFTILGVLFRKRKSFGKILSFLEKVDGAVLKVPGINLMAWQTVFFLGDPIK